MATGYRMQAISILGKNVMQPRGLIGLGHDSLANCGPEIAQALRSILPSTPLLAHCTQGKDRTGLLIFLLLSLLSIPVAAITHDYILSEAALLPERASRLEEIHAIGLTDDFAGCPPDWIEKMDEYLKETWGGVEAYCESIGFGNAEQDELRRGLGV